MEFKAKKGIYLQIADNLCQQILAGELGAMDRVPSVRDMAVSLQVNRNTVMRTYTYLQEIGVFLNKRGVGFFIAEDAVNQIQKREKESFIQDELPGLIKKVKLLQLNSNQLADLIQQIQQND
ncbi:GntR family transcriptional regulator [Sediminicola luteus]|uniref:GntR family transcriptional regulator n=1 Tax=Sediminicola luteus TaxID=319238 RepID=A0A2A4G6H4_9FLAO|nr:GntR family transcriptional regulator [Sediminicola luteus]PCE63345.1 GntR family transcriptional regulator [Sediminicola luteus]